MTPDDDREVERTKRAGTPADRTALAAGRYQVVRLLGEGAQKIVYLVHDTALDRDCALSLIKTELLDPEDVARLRNEARSMARLGAHPNIVTVHDIGEENGRPFIVCEYVAGGDLREALQQAGGPLPLDRTVAITQDLCRALAVAHRRGIVHRDVKPGNIWLTEEGTAKLGDFGLAIGAGYSRLTLAGTVLGTAAYMAPEQALGQEVDERSDLYSLGCVLYQMLAGRPPFSGDDPLAVIAQHINVVPPALRRHGVDVPPGLDRLAHALLAKAKDERPSSAQDVLAQLEWFAQAARLSSAVTQPMEDSGRRPPPPIPATPGGRGPPRPPRWPAQRRGRDRPEWRYAVLGVALAAVLAGAGFALAFFLAGRGDGGSEVATGLEAATPTSEPAVTSSATPGPPTPEGGGGGLPRGRLAQAIAYAGTDGNLWLADADGPTRERLTSEGGVAHPAWSPDGRQLAYVRQRDDAAEIRVIDLETKEERLVLAAIRYASGGESRVAAVRGPAWDPSGNAILYYELRGPLATGRIRRHPLGEPQDTSDERDETLVDASQLEADQHLGGGFAPFPSADRLAFEICTSEPGACGIFTIGLGRDERPAGVVNLMTGQFYGLPAVAPDGRRIAFYSYPGTPQNFIELVDIETGERNRLGEAYATNIRDDPFWPKISWSGDSNLVTYETVEAGRKLIIVHDVGGGQPRELAEGRHPAWAPR